MVSIAIDRSLTSNREFVHNLNCLAEIVKIIQRSATPPPPTVPLPTPQPRFILTPPESPVSSVPSPVVSPWCSSTNSLDAEDPAATQNHTPGLPLTFGTQPEDLDADDTSGSRLTPVEDSDGLKDVIPLGGSASSSLPLDLSENLSNPYPYLPSENTRPPTARHLRQLSLPKIRALSYLTQCLNPTPELQRCLSEVTGRALSSTRGTRTR